MKKLLIFFIILLFFAAPAAEAAQTMSQRLSGRFLLQVQMYGRLWYVNPKDGWRYYIKGDEGFETLKKLSIEISQKDLNKIPLPGSKNGDSKLIRRLSGRILNDGIEDRLWYLDALTKTRRLIEKKNISAAISSFSLGINDKNLSKIPMNKTQIAFDGTFTDVAHVKYDGQAFSKGYYADKILPPASMTKLMTALILFDLNFNFEQNLNISEEQIKYPLKYSGGDKTSEIDLATGDTVLAKDLLAALLISSSNQAATILADATGLNRPEFIKLMNKKAAKLGLKKTVFYDVSGLDPHNVTTAKEMAIIAKTAFEIPRIAETSVLNEYIMAALDVAGHQKNITLANRNFSLLQFDPDGVKTGYLVEAQRTAVVKKGNNIVVVMHATSMNQRNKIFTNLLK